MLSAIRESCIEGSYAICYKRVLFYSPTIPLIDNYNFSSWLRVGGSFLNKIVCYWNS